MLARPLPRLSVACQGIILILTAILRDVLVNSMRKNENMVVTFEIPDMLYDCSYASITPYKLQIMK